MITTTIKNEFEQILQKELERRRFEWKTSIVKFVRIILEQSKILKFNKGTLKENYKFFMDLIRDSSKLIAEENELYINLNTINNTISFEPYNKFRIIAIGKSKKPESIIRIFGIFRTEDEANKSLYDDGTILHEFYDVKLIKVEVDKLTRIAIFQGDFKHWH